MSGVFLDEKKPQVSRVKSKGIMRTYIMIVVAGGSHSASILKPLSLLLFTPNSNDI